MISPSNASAAATIDVDNPPELQRWAEKFDASPEQVREAVRAVGNHPEDVEMHLKGSRSTTNSDRVAREG